MTITFPSGDEIFACLNPKTAPDPTEAQCWNDFFAECCLCCDCPEQVYVRLEDVGMYPECVLNCAFADAHCFAAMRWDAFAEAAINSLCGFRIPLNEALTDDEYCVYTAAFGLVDEFGGNVPSGLLAAYWDSFPFPGPEPCGPNKNTCDQAFFTYLFYWCIVFRVALRRSDRKIEYILVHLSRATNCDGGSSVFWRGCLFDGGPPPGRICTVCYFANFTIVFKQFDDTFSSGWALGEEIPNILNDDSEICCDYGGRPPDCDSSALSPVCDAVGVPRPYAPDASGKVVLQPWGFAPHNAQVGDGGKAFVTLEAPVC